MPVRGLLGGFNSWTLLKTVVFQTVIGKWTMRYSCPGISVDSPDVRALTWGLWGAGSLADGYQHKGLSTNFQPAAIFSILSMRVPATTLGSQSLLTTR